jgi:hypothetical protein
MTALQPTGLAVEATTFHVSFHAPRVPDMHHVWSNVLSLWHLCALLSLTSQPLWQQSTCHGFETPPEQLPCMEVLAAVHW